MNRYGYWFVPRQYCFPIIISVVFFIFLFWFVLQVLAPFCIPFGVAQDLSGMVAVIDNQDVIDNVSFPWKGIYAAGDRLCHQQVERSLILNGNAMPFCSRCTALFFGMVIGLGVMIRYRVILDNRFLYVMVLGFFPLGVDGIGQLFGFWESSNIIRIVTGMLAGGTCGIGLGVIVDELKDLLKKSVQ